MAKSVADDPILRNARNFGLIALVFVLIFGIFYYVAGATLISLTSPSLDYTKKFFAKGFIDQVIIIAKSFYNELNRKSRLIRWQLLTICCS